MTSESFNTPRSMPIGQRNQIRPNDSASLWNYSLSPGWTQEESEILRKALIKFGVGQWTRIMESGCLPGKTIVQLNLQTQRMCGQQSTAEFSGLHMDITEVGRLNSQRVDVLRKGGLIINDGRKPTFKEVKQKLVENRTKFELAESIWRAIELPRPAMSLKTLEQKKQQLARLQQELSILQGKIKEKTLSLLEKTRNSADFSTLYETSNTTNLSENGRKRQRNCQSRISKSIEVDLISTSFTNQVSEELDYEIDILS